MKNELIETACPHAVGRTRPSPATAPLILALALVVTPGAAFGTILPPNEARVTRIIQDVTILPDGGDAHAAALDDAVTDNTAVHTGNESRSELTFFDETITRLGANTVFTFQGRNVQLDQGAILFRLPKDSGGAAIRTKAVTVGITGTTVIVRFTSVGRSILIVLEGHARFGLVNYPSEFADVSAGQMVDVPLNAIKVPRPRRVDLDRLMKTEPLLTDFPALPSQNLIAAAAQAQQGGKGRGVKSLTRTTGGNRGNSPLPNPAPPPVRTNVAPIIPPAPVYPTDYHSNPPSHSHTDRSPRTGPTHTPKHTSTAKPTPTPTPHRTHSTDGPQKTPTPPQLPSGHGPKRPPMKKPPKSSSPPPVTY